MGGHFLLRHMTARKMNRLISLTTALALLALSSASYSQTDLVNIRPPSPESEYQKELDKWMLQAYEGDRDAQFKVGVLFTNDQFQSADMEQAVYWYKQAARQGHALSQYNLGHQYLTGVGVKRSESEAMKWWLKAAVQDHPLAQFNLGRAYYLGIGVQKDHDQSRYWFDRAAQNNEPKSIDILEQLKWSEPGEYQASKKPNKAQARPTDQLAMSPDMANRRKQKLEEKLKATEESVTDAQTNEADISQQTANAASDAIGQMQGVGSQIPSDGSQKQEQISKQGNATDDSNKADLTAAELAANPIAVYTNPKKRSVLITMLDVRKQLTTIKTSPEWTQVSSDDGFPVWVHRDYIQVSDDIGTISGNGVNARSVPLITNGSIVGSLNNDETLAVLDKKNAWYRVMSPSRFKAWVKTDEFHSNKTLTTIAQSSNSKAQGSNSKTQSSNTNKSTSNTAKTANTSQDSPSEAANDTPVNDEKWLFSQPADGYTLQLASFENAERVAAFKARKDVGDSRELHSFNSIGKDIQWTFFLYGAFKSHDAASQARIEIGQKQAWVRSFGRLQQNRCLAWKKQTPSPKELNRHCS
jgi:TPR repeat protein